MNFSILKQEFANLIDVLNSSSKEPVNEVIPRTFFNPENNQGLVISSHSAGISIKDTGIVRDNVGFKKTNRQNIILGLLKKKKELTIKDIALIIKDCSEKTIQRELISLISLGVLKRTGERRWSKYSLSQQ